MNKEIITFQINEPLLKKLDGLAKDLEVSRSDIIRMAIKDYITNHGKNLLHQEYGKYAV